MSKEYQEICKSIQASNAKLYNGDQQIMNEIKSIENDLKAISKKLDKVVDMVVRLLKESSR